MNELKAEIDAIKLLKYNKYVVSFIDSHGSKYFPLEGAYEVLVLMEYCARAGLIHFMNTRLKNRLQESVILK